MSTVNEINPVTISTTDPVSAVTINTVLEPPMPGWAIVVTGIGLCIVAVVVWLWLVSCANRSQSRQNRQLEDHPYPWYCCVLPKSHPAPKSIAQRKRRLRLKQAQQELKAMASSDDIVAGIPQRNRIGSTRSSTSSTGKRISFKEHPTQIRDRHTSEPNQTKTQNLHNNSLRDRHTSDPTKSVLRNSHVNYDTSDNGAIPKDTEVVKLLDKDGDGSVKIDMPPTYSDVMKPSQEELELEGSGDKSAQKCLIKSDKDDEDEVGHGIESV